MAASDGSTREPQVRRVPVALDRLAEDRRGLRHGTDPLSKTLEETAARDLRLYARLDVVRFGHRIGP